MTHNHNPFEVFKQACKAACHERHACTHGYIEMMDAKNIEEVATVWRRYWREIVGEMYADVIREEMPHHYIDIKEGFNLAGVYFNECPSSRQTRAFAIVGDSAEALHVYGYAEVHVIGEAHVVAHDHARVFCSRPQAKIELLDYAYGEITNGYGIARNYSTLVSTTECESHNASVVTLRGGVLHDYGHYDIKAYNDAVIDSFTTMRIALFDNAKINIRKKL